jgi:hypothetical protein
MRLRVQADGGNCATIESLRSLGLLSGRGGLGEANVSGYPLEPKIPLTLHTITNQEGTDHANQGHIEAGGGKNSGG